MNEIRTAPGAPVGAGSLGTVEVAVVVPVIVNVAVAAVDVQVAVAVTVGELLSPFFSLCSAPANRPMNTEVSRSRNSTNTNRIFVNGVNGS